MQKHSTRMLDFGQFDFGQFDFGQNCPTIRLRPELSEVELAEVEVGRSRIDGVCFVSSFSLSYFFMCFVFTFLNFFLFWLISLFILFLCCFCFRPQNSELNPKPQTVHPFSDGPFRWTPPPVNPPPPDNPPPDNPPPDRPKFRSFFPSSRQNFHSPTFQKDVDMLQIIDSELLFIDVRLMFRSHVTTPHLRSYDSRYDSNARKSNCRWQKWLITINHLEIESHDLIQTQKVTTRTLRDCPQIKCWRNPSSPRRHRDSPYYTRIYRNVSPARSPHEQQYLLFGAPHFVVPKFNIQKMAEVEIGRSRNWPKSTWPKSKLAEVDRAPFYTSHYVRNVVNWHTSLIAFDLSKKHSNISCSLTCVSSSWCACMCVTVWVHFGSILGPFWVHFGSILGPFWVHFGSILGPFWVHFGSMSECWCILKV